ncbi:hypothetical protein [Aliivibrio fischeri]|uniref:hypothetical protein n=1 Tax=Aliivibrio fischeri TaxID=668 RepID=UPI0007C47FAC|nr:hypothetical protein [Aliivibrio fischeri]
MKFRIIFDQSTNEITIITEEGGIACIREAEKSSDETRTAITDYYQLRISNEMNSDTLFESLAEGKMYNKDWFDVKYNSLDAIQDALDWLCAGQTNWEITNDLYSHIFDYHEDKS